MGVQKMLNFSACKQRKAFNCAIEPTSRARTLGNDFFAHARKYIACQCFAKFRCVFAQDGMSFVEASKVFNFRKRWRHSLAACCVGPRVRACGAILHSAKESDSHGGKEIC